MASNRIDMQRLFLILALCSTVAAVRPIRSRPVQRLRPLPLPDSVQIDVSNGMPHAMRLLYAVDTGLASLATVGAGEEKLVTIRGLTRDSVTVWATNDNPPHKFSKTFPVHSSAPLTWEF